MVVYTQVKWWCMHMHVSNALGQTCISALKVRLWRYTMPPCSRNQSMLLWVAALAEPWASPKRITGIRLGDLSLADKSATLTAIPKQPWSIMSCMRMAARVLCCCSQQLNARAEGNKLLHQHLYSWPYKTVRATHRSSSIQREKLL